MRYVGLGSPIIYDKSVLWGYSPAPNQTEIRLRNSKISFDENGFRVAQPFNQDNQIIFFGDSVTYGGSYIDDKDIFSSLTCEMLNAKAVLTKYSCANAGVNSYGVRNMLARILYVEQQFPHATLIITVISDDFYRNFVSLAGLPFFTIKPPEPFPATMELLAFAIDKLRVWLRFRGERGSLSSETSSNRNTSSMTHIEVDMVARSLEELTRRREKEGKATIVVWSPSREWFNGTQSPEEKYLYEKLASLKLNVIDMTATLRLSQKSATEIFYDDAHLERVGHRIYAETISQQFRSPGKSK